MSEESYYISTTYATGLVTVVNNIIIETPNIWKRFKNQSLNNLTTWLTFKDKNIIIIKLKGV